MQGGSNGGSFLCELLINAGQARVYISPHQPIPLLDLEDLVDTRNSDFFPVTARPVDLNSVDFALAAQSKMHRKASGRKEKRTLLAQYVLHEVTQLLRGKLVAFDIGK